MILIKNGRVLTMAGATYEDGFLLINGRTIERVGAAGDLEASMIDHASLVIDARGGWVLPGIVEAHCHMGISGEKVGMEGNDCNETMEPVTPYLRALDAINPMDAAFHGAILAGITSAMIGPGSSNVVGGQFVFIKTDGRCLDDLIVMQPAAMKVAFGENPKKNYLDQSRMPSTRMSVAAMLRKELTLAKQYQRAKAAAERDGKDFDEDFRYECWLPVLNREIPIKAHVHRADDILTAIRIAREFSLRLTLDHCTEGHLIAEEIKKSGFPAIVGPSIASRRKPEVQYGDFKTAGVLNRAGVKVAITTDHPVSLIQYLPICAGLAAREGLGIEEALKAITISAAEICNVADRVGSLAPGKDADVAVFSGNPLEVFTKTLYTIIDGRIVYDRDAAKGS
jgi:imidazolonepropionase-like amidohydrolase